MTGDDLSLSGLLEGIGRLKAQQDRFVIEDQMRAIQAAYLTIYDLGGMMAVHEAYGRAMAEVMDKRPMARGLGVGL